MKSYWVMCIKGTSQLREGERYLITPIGKKAKVLRDSTNPHRRYRTVNKDRFKLLVS